MQAVMGRQHLRNDDGDQLGKSLLRIMEEDRCAFLEETGVALAKQRSIISILRKERDALLEDASVARCAIHKRKDEEFTEKVAMLASEKEEKERVLKEEKERLKELDEQIRKLEDNIRVLRPKSAVSDEDYIQRLASGQRSHFNEVCEKLLRDVNTGKKFMVELIEHTTVAFDQREEFCSKLELLKKRTMVDELAHTEEMREIHRQLDHDLTLREFLSVKGQKRILKDLEEKERIRLEDEAESLENQLLVYEKTLEQIQQFIDEKSVDRIASQYLKQEEENFALFNYVNELNHEIELLNACILEMQEQIDEQIEMSSIRAKERQATLKSLKLDLEAAGKKANEDKENLEKAKEELHAVLDGIEEVFYIASCDRGPILDLLGNSSDINLFNVKIYLGTIEKKISSIVTKLYFAEKAILKHSKKFSSKEEPVTPIQ
ncbi:unnamed protein product [Acanthoscelides obtectus]|uniref:ODAD1 central coiled coil region domain-containing protein n=1 Tax=Acanthoscelides obtectus TaxID=200917 RepID=A0A9P0JYX3_ACAOB|nr:unnamed protein product [Acanthoscelides obtectus]CAK1639061.1 Coiled-coil domain-containing protein 114 [Acanthoscelides obtectus]